MTTERQALALATVKNQQALVARLPSATREALELLERFGAKLAAEHGGRPMEDVLGSDERPAVLGHAYVFDAPVDALAWAQRLQRECLHLPWPAALMNHPAAQVEHTASGELRYRGLRVAVAIHADKADGLGLHQLARLGGVLEPGRLLLSKDAAFAVEGAAFAGRSRIGGLLGDRPIYEFVVEGLGRTFPPVGTTPPLDAEEDGRVYGREGDLAALKELLGVGVHVISITGTLGVGKTRLVERFVRNARKSGKRVSHLDLEMATDGWDLLHALSRELRVTVRESGSIEEAVKRVLHAAEYHPADVICLSNVRAGVVPILAAIVKEAAETTWVVDTPRIGVAGEVVYTVLPLAFSDSRAGDAVRLLDEAARRIQPRFTLGTGSEACAVANEVGGIPLCIELAAIGTCALRPLALFERLTALRGEPTRIFAIVLDTLPEAQVRVLADLAAFAHTFDRTFAIQVVTPDLEEAERAEAIGALIALGLVRSVQSPWAPGVLRLRLHRRVRSLVAELREPSEHCGRRIAAGLAVSMMRWMTDLDGWRGDRVMARIQLERLEIRKAIETLLGLPRVTAEDLGWLAVLLDGAARVATEYGPISRMEDPLGRALTAAGSCLDADPHVVGKLFRVRGRVFRVLGFEERSLGDLSRAQSLAERWASPRDIARAQLEIAMTHLGAGAPEVAEQHLNTALNIFEELGLELDAAQVKARLGGLLMRRGSLDEAAANFDEAALVLERQGHAAMRALVAGGRAVVHRERGERAEAEGHYRRALGLWMCLGRGVEELRCRFRLATLLHTAGRLDEAGKLFDVAAQDATRRGDHGPLGLALTHLGLIALERGDPVEAQALLVRAVSAARSGGDRAGQGAATGFLGLLAHLQGQLPDARDKYRAALLDLEMGGGRKYGALFHSCLGAAEAQLGNLEDAGILVDLAELQLADAEPGLREAMGVFHQVLQLARADAAEAHGDLGAAEVLRSQVALVLDAGSVSSSNVYLRFAHQHLSSLRAGH